MRIIQKPVIALAIILISIACKSKKNSTSAAVTGAVSPAITAAPPVTNSVMFPARSPEGVYVPGNEELAAIQAHYSDVTLEKLNEGYALYTGSECMGCHKPKSIYKREEARWKGIIDDMAKKAKISDTQKDAVYKYVLAIKATQPK
jgi:hypothetical protein